MEGSRATRANGGGQASENRPRRGEFLTNTCGRLPSHGLKKKSPAIFTAEQGGCLTRSKRVGESERRYSANSPTGTVAEYRQL